MKQVSKLMFGVASGMMLTAGTLSAQLTIDGQVITRGDYRHGFGGLVNSSNQPAAFFF